MLTEIQKLLMLTDKFVIGKYIEISIGRSTGIVYADSDPHSFSVAIQ